MHAPVSNTRPIRIVYVNNNQHGELQWRGQRRLWVPNYGGPVLFNRNATRLGIRAMITLRLGVPVSAVELRATARTE